MRRAYNLLLLAIVGLAWSGPAHCQSHPSDMEIVQALRAGGHVIVIRHGATNEDQADVDPLNTDNIAKQRQGATCIIGCFTAIECNVFYSAAPDDRGARLGRPH